MISTMSNEINSSLEANTNSTSTSSSRGVNDEENSNYVEKKVKLKLNKSSVGHMLNGMITANRDQTSTNNPNNNNNNNSTMLMMMNNSNENSNGDAEGLLVVNGRSVGDQSHSGSNSPASSNSSSASDPRAMDAADTLMCLAHSANSTPTVESKPFVQASSTTNANNIEIFVNTAEDTINLNELNRTPRENANKNTLSSSSTAAVAAAGASESMATTGDAAAATAATINLSSLDGSNQNIIESCKVFIEQVLKNCPNANLSSITIKTTSIPKISITNETASKSEDSNAASASATNTTTTTASTQLVDQAKLAVPTTTTTVIELKNDLKASETTPTSVSPAKLTVKKFRSSLDSGAQPADVKTQPSTKIITNEIPRMQFKLENENSNSSSMFNYDDNSNESSLSGLKRPLKNRQTNNLANMTRVAPTLATGRKSKDIELPPDEAKKRQERRERNKEAAARCRRRREDLTVQLTNKTEELRREQDNLKRQFNELLNEKNRLENVWQTHEKSCAAKVVKLDSAATATKTGNHQDTLTAAAVAAVAAAANQQYQQQQQQQQNLLKLKKEDLNELLKIHPKYVNQNNLSLGSPFGAQYSSSSSSSSSGPSSAQSQSLGQIMLQSSPSQLAPQLNHHHHHHHHNFQQQQSMSELNFLNLVKSDELAMMHENEKNNLNFFLSLKGAAAAAAAVNHNNSANSTLMTPNSAVFNHNSIENILSQLDQSQKSLLTPTSSTSPLLMNLNTSSGSTTTTTNSSSYGNSSSSSGPPATNTNTTPNTTTLQRPNNLNLKLPSLGSSSGNSSSQSITSSTSNTPSCAALTPSQANQILQGLALVINSAVSSNNNNNTGANQMSMGASSSAANSNFYFSNANKLNLLATPTIQLNTPLFTLTPIEANLNAFANMPTPIGQQTPILSIPTPSLVLPTSTLSAGAANNTATSSTANSTTGNSNNNLSLKS